MSVAGPTGRHVSTVVDDERRTRVVHRVPGESGSLLPPVRATANYIAKVGGVLERTCHLGLHGHVPGGLTRLLGVRPVIVGIPEPCAARDSPRVAFELPCQRG